MRHQSGKRLRSQRVMPVWELPGQKVQVPEAPSARPLLPRSLRRLVEPAKGV